MPKQLKHAPHVRSAMQPLALEPRLLFDASLGGVLDLAAQLLDPVVNETDTVAAEEDLLALVDDTLLTEDVAVGDDGLLADGVAAFPGGTATGTVVGDQFDGGEGASLRGNVLFNDLPLSDMEFRVEVLAQPRHGQLNLNPETGAFEYRPNPGFTGRDSFDYAIYAGDRYLGQAKVDLQIGNATSPPPDQLVPQNDQPAAEDPPPLAEAPPPVADPPPAHGADGQLSQTPGMAAYEAARDTRIVEFQQEAPPSLEVVQEVRDQVARTAEAAPRAPAEPVSEPPPPVEAPPLPGDGEGPPPQELQDKLGAWINGVWVEDAPLPLEGAEQVQAQAQAGQPQPPPAPPPESVPPDGEPPPTAESAQSPNTEGFSKQLEKAGQRMDSNQREIQQVLDKITRIMGCGR